MTVAVDLKEILEGARVLAHQAEKKTRLTDTEYDEVIRTLVGLAVVLNERAPYKVVREKARYLVSSAREMERE